MTMAATSLKLSRRLKSRLERLARRAGESPHAFMLRALEGHIDAVERYEEFVRDGMRADEAMQQSGLGYGAEAAHAYLKAKASGAKARRPRATRWRR